MEHNPPRGTEVNPLGSDDKAVFLDFDSVDAGDLDTRVLRDVLPAIRLYPASAPAEVPARVRQATIVVTNKVPLDGEFMDASPGLRLICLAATGTDNVDLAAARDRGIAVCNIRNYCTDSVVQHVYSLILALTRRLAGYSDLVAGGTWSDQPQFCLLDIPVRELGGRRLGLVGYGTLGRAVAKVAPAFGLKVVVSARPGSPATSDRPAFETVLETADVVSLHCPLTPATRNMMDAAALARMRPDALLINTARGALVDSAALADALRGERLGGAGIDVLPVEPPGPDEPLLAPGIPNLIVTPHIAWASRRARQRAIDEIAANVRAFLGGQSRNRVN